MAPAPDTIDAIFSVVKALNESQRKGWEMWKIHFWSRLAIFQIWVPLILLVLACILAVINRWVGSPSLTVGSLLLLVLMYSELTPCSHNTSFHAALRVFAIFTLTLCST